MLPTGRRELSDFFREALVIILALPIVGLFMGAVFSFPAMKVSRGRDPWLTLLLALALAVTVFGVGIPAGGAPRHLLLVLGLALLLLLLVRLFVWSFDGNAERFGMIHGLTLVLLLVVVMVDRRLRAR